MKDKEILLEWAKTYGEDKDDVRASMYGVDLMIEFAKYYHTEQLRLGVVSQQREQVCTLHSTCQYQSGFTECSYLLQCDYKKQTCG